VPEPENAPEALTVMTLAITPPRRPEIEYPDSDGKPMSDNTRQFEWIVTIKEGLEALYRTEPLVFVGGDLLWYAQEGNPKVRTAPDAMVVFGRPKGYRGSYKQWLEDGIAPQVVFEVLSPGNRPRELTAKFKFYEKHGVDEYYRHDPDNGALKGWLRGSAGLDEIADMNGHTSPRLGIRFEPGKGPDSLKIIGPDGHRFLTYVELFEEREAERHRADEAQRRADTEKQRAESLAAKLRELGVEPD
jgi:Uma2 family endonuclease